MNGRPDHPESAGTSGLGGDANNITVTATAFIGAPFVRLVGQCCALLSEFPGSYTVHRATGLLA